jgi:uncharacterized membrane protein
MKKLIKFIKTTVIGGLVVIVPLAILAYAVGEMAVTLVEYTTPLTSWMPFHPAVNALIASGAAIAATVVIFFFAGLLVNTLWGRAVRRFTEEKIFSRIPMYSALKGLTQRFAGIENSGFPVVEVDLYGSGCRVLGVAVEDLPDGRRAIYVPSSPIATVGQMMVAPQEAVTELDASLRDMFTSVSQMGIETTKLYGEQGTDRS